MKIHLMAILTGFFLDMLLGDPYSFSHPVRAIGGLIGRLETALRRQRGADGTWRAAGEGAGGEAADGEKLMGEIPVGENPVGENPVGENPVSEILAGEIPADEILAGKNSTGDCASRKELAAGRWLVFIVLLVTGAVSGGLCIAAGMAGGIIFFAVEAVLSYYLLAARSLYDESMKVYHSLKSGDVEGARRNVSMIVGRDTADLSDREITKAAVETVAENTSDGVIAPLFYLAIGGPVLGFLYKAVNTMDSMVGYKNARYLYFGRTAARLDDLLNLIPARLSAFLMILAAFVLRMDFKNAVRIYKRDRRCHKSPNSAQTEAVCAGALRIQLAGDAWYFGTLCKKQFIGDPLREVEYEDIRRANRLMYVTTVLCLLLIAAAAALLSL